MNQCSCAKMEEEMSSHWRSAETSRQRRKQIQICSKS